MISRTRLLSRAVAVFITIGPTLICPVFATDASASVSIAVTWSGLLHDSTEAAVVTSVESRTVWEDGRIYTYSRVHVDRPIAGSLGTGADAWIRTMGGIVGRVGQIVEGEASFAPGETSLLFLRPGPVGAFVVTARGQGQFPVVIEGPKAPPHIIKSNDVGMLLPPRGAAASLPGTRLAADVLHGRLLDDVARDIAADWGASHAR